MLFTAYLALLNKLRQEKARECTRKASSRIMFDIEKALELHGLKQPKVYYVMRNRGNDAVAPSKDLLEWFLRKKKLWAEQWESRGKMLNWREYKQKYLEQLDKSTEANEWIAKVAAETQGHDVVLVCYEKDGQHCHRTLLARRMACLHPTVNYAGELKV